MSSKKINHFIYKGESITNIILTLEISFNIPTYIYFSNLHYTLEVLYDINLPTDFFSLDNMSICSNYIRTGYLSSNLQEILEEVKGNIKTPVTNKILNKLEKKDELVDCVICLERKNKKCCLECNHPVCFDCMYHNLSSYSNKCPVCRKVISEEVVKKNYTNNERLLGYFIYTYCNRCNECTFHKNLNEKINLFIKSGGDITY